MGGVVDADNLSLWFITLDGSNKVVSDVFIVGGNHFEHTFVIKAGEQTVRLISSKYARPSDIDPKSTDTRLLSVMIDGLESDSADTKLIVPGEIKREVIDGYARRFTLGHELASNNITRPLILTLPLAYSRFNEITQGGRKLHSRPSALGLTLVNVENFSTPVISVYRLPLVSIVVSSVGATVWIFLFVYCFIMKAGLKL